MTPIPITPETLAAARAIIWFEPPESALADPIRLMAYAMAFALPEHMRILRRYVSDDDFREAIDHAPPGIVDPRSWAYWNSKMGRYPPPPLPARRFDDFVGTRAGAISGMGQVGEQLRYGRMAWLRMREQRPAKTEPDELRRRARETWLAEYGPKKKPET